MNKRKFAILVALVMLGVGVGLAQKGITRNIPPQCATNLYYEPADMDFQFIAAQTGDYLQRKIKWKLTCGGPKNVDEICQACVGWFMEYSIGDIDGDNYTEWYRDTNSGNYAGTTYSKVCNATPYIKDLDILDDRWNVDLGGPTREVPKRHYRLRTAGLPGPCPVGGPFSAANKIELVLDVNNCGTPHNPLCP